MKIKTITEELAFAGVFDSRVNENLAKGWHLVRRDIIPAGPNPNSHRLLYAELVQLDPVPEPQPVDHFEALRAIKAACLNVPQTECNAGRCPLYSWCRDMSEYTDPTDWDLPEKEAPEA